MQECGLMPLTQQLNIIGCGIITANQLIHIVLDILPVTIIVTITVPLPWFIRHIMAKEQLQKMSYRRNAMHFIFHCVKLQERIDVVRTLKYK